jgi:thymidylate synthase (FAD)
LNPHDITPRNPTDFSIPEFKENSIMSIEELKWKKYPVLNDGFICLVDAMGDDSSIVQAARVSYGNDNRTFVQEYIDNYPEMTREQLLERKNKLEQEVSTKDRALIRYLLAHSHTTPFEMVELTFLVRVPMDCWRQWIRHRTANVNEYSTRYTEAIDSQQTTQPDEWRLQATDNKQGSSGFLEEWPEGWKVFNRHNTPDWYITSPNSEVSTLIVSYTKPTPGQYLSEKERIYGSNSQNLYQERLALGIAKEQARKDLPLSTYTEAYWKCDLHNIFNFLRLRMDSHAQLEIRLYANAMYEIIKQVCPVACEAFEDYVLHAKKFSRMEMEVLQELMGYSRLKDYPKPSSMTDREWKEFLGKLS